uniref:Uncharacterized protein n=1 Tax=Romanomermis culicivorax TaxID=13658 RepID=A0A915L1W9_ROMCU
MRNHQQYSRAISDQFQAQQLPVQCEIQEQTKATNARFAALAEQIQQLISTTAAATNVHDYYDHPQPGYELRHMSHREEDSRIKTIVDNMQPLIIDGA